MRIFISPVSIFLSYSTNGSWNPSNIHEHLSFEMYSQSGGAQSDIKSESVPYILNTNKKPLTCFPKQATFPPYHSPEFREIMQTNHDTT